jgi:hypothetical protein
VPLSELAEFSGFLAAHAVWSVSSGETLIPMAGIQQLNGERSLVRFMAERFEEGVEKGRAWLAENGRTAARQVLVFDGFIRLGDEKVDAIILEGVDHAHAGKKMTWMVPYRPAKSPSEFAVHRPKVSLDAETTDQAANALHDVFWEGVDAHTEGAAIWKARLDQSR